MKKNRLTISQYPEGVEVNISAAKSPFVNILLVIWLISWIVGEWKIGDRILTNEGKTPDAFIVFWALGWSLSGLLAAFVWLWNMKGREVVRISNSGLTRSRQYGFFSRSKIYEAIKISNLRLSDVSPTALEMSGGMEFWGLSGGMISFDYERDIQKFGLGISEPEAIRVIDVIKARFDNF